ncbi:Chloramphenicol O-acetyltransferase type A [Tenacibaculum sp. 190130A14a]|uniref:Chloramphenicol O-acetyltransferase type A n=1 Tax=Tenacibaculum polynesiense TaxID=3137857 RepID=A0ABM9PEW0_9FLAO
MKYLDIDSWNRKELFHHFRTLKDPTFGLVADVEVTRVFKDSKEKGDSFFVRYLHACMTAINNVEALKYRVEGDKIAVYETIHASATIAREDHTFGFSFVEFNENFVVFNNNFQKEKKRIQETRDLFPPKYSLGCIHCSAIPWVSFSGHKEPFSGNKDDSVPQLAFGKIKEENDKLMMPVAINVNHALVDGYHVGLFFEEFQNQLDKIN